MKVASSKYFGALLGALFSLAATRADAATFTVTNTNGSGTGSLVAAVTNASNIAGADTVVFNIPTTDPNFRGGVFTIIPSAGLFLGSSTSIDGATQTLFSGDTNPSGPEILVRNMGFDLSGNDNLLANLVITTGMRITGNRNKLQGCYIGTNAAGSADFDSGADSEILITRGGDNIIGGLTPGQGNVISGSFYGMRMSECGANNQVLGNKIGTDATGTRAIPNQYGIYFDGGTNAVNTTFANNVISGNGGGGSTGNGLTVSAPQNQVTRSVFITGNKDSRCRPCPNAPHPHRRAPAPACAKR